MRGQVWQTLKVPWQGKASGTLCQKPPQERGRGPQLLSLMLPQGACVVLASRCGAGLRLGPLVLAVQGREQSSSLPPALLHFSAFLIFFSPSALRGFLLLTLQLLGTCRVLPTSLDKLCPLVGALREKWTQFTIAPVLPSEMPAESTGAGSLYPSPRGPGFWNLDQRD